MPRRCSFKLELDFPQPLAGVDEAGCAPLAGPVVAARLHPRPRQIPARDRRLQELAAREARGALRQAGQMRGLGRRHRERRGDRPDQHLLGADAGDDPRGRGAGARAGLGAGRRQCDCPRWQRPSKAIVDGDAKCRSIAAASIIAKVTRDRIMVDYAREYPGYGWEQNRGYPTPDHRRALDALGPTPLHRRSFATGARRSRARRQPELVFEEIGRASPSSHTHQQVESAPPSDDSTSCGGGRGRPPSIRVPKRRVNP